MALEAIREAYRVSDVAINCVTYGDDLFIRYWPSGEKEEGDPSADTDREYWRAYGRGSLSASYFVSNLVDSLCKVTNSVWFALENGKKPTMIKESPLA
jgi:hypothetical protein